MKIINYLSYFIFTFYFIYFSRNLLYHPNENNYFGDQLKVDIEKVQIKTVIILNLLGWFHKKDLKNLKL